MEGPYSSIVQTRPLSTPSQDEAFELGCKWAYVYDAGSPSRKLIRDIMNNFYLVNVVHNDFKDPYAIFPPFFKAGDEYAALRQEQNYVAKTNGFVN